MGIVQSYSNFRVKCSLWTEIEIINITQIVDYALSEFFVHLDRTKILTKQVHITSSFAKTPPADYPDIFNTKAFAFIYLSAKDDNWSQYIYEFSHELCHFIIDSENYNKQHLFGWIEESLCELASWFVLHEMNIGWQIFPPYEELKDFAISVSDYADKTFPLQGFGTSKPFHDWVEENISDLSKNRYLRHKNVIIAAHLFPLFVANTQLWTAVQYLNQVSSTADSTLAEFLYQWNDFLPSKLQESFSQVIQLFLGLQK